MLRLVCVLDCCVLLLRCVSCLVWLFVNSVGGCSFFLLKGFLSCMVWLFDY